MRRTLASRAAPRARASTLAAILAVASVAGPAAPAGATLVLALELPELVWRSDRVVLADVLTVRSAWDARRERIESMVELDVLETWKGASAPHARVLVRQGGGTAGGIAMVVVGAPRFIPGERTVVFLRGPAERSAVVGMAQGKRSVTRHPQSGVWMAQAGAAGATTLAPGADGRLGPGRVDPERPLAELRAQVTALARR